MTRSANSVIIECVICGNPGERDGEFCWCEHCGHRRRLLAWGKAHGYPDLKLGTYAIGSDKYCWEVACLMGVDDLVWTGIAYIECAESNEEDLIDE